MNKVLGIMVVAFCMLGAYGTPIKSNLGGEGVDCVEASEYTAADYIQDGLIAMWDGIENVGWGEHDADARQWLALVGGGVLDIPANGSFIDNGLLIDRSMHGYKSTSQTSYPFWQEYVAALDQGTVTYENSYTLFEYGESESSGLNHLIRNVVNPGGVYGHLCPRSENLIYLNSNCSGTGYYWQLSSVDTTVGQHSMSATYDRQNGRYLNNMYFDGTFMSSKVNPGTAIADVDVTFNALRAGSLLVGARYGIASVDVIHNFRIYNRELSPEEVAYNARIDKERFGL